MISGLQLIQHFLSNYKLDKAHNMLMVDNGLLGSNSLGTTGPESTATVSNSSSPPVCRLNWPCQIQCVGPYSRAPHTACYPHQLPCAHATCAARGMQARTSAVHALWGPEGLAQSAR